MIITYKLPKISKKAVLILTAVYFLVLFAFPGFLIYDYNNILATGETYKIKVSAYDPYDPFRGRYVQIRPDIRELRWGIHPVIILEKDAQDFVVSAYSVNNSNAPGAVRNFKLERYYLNEKTAPKIEERLLWRNIEQDDLIYVTIKVKNGRFAVEGMYINNIAVEDYVRR